MKTAWILGVLLILAVPGWAVADSSSIGGQTELVISAYQDGATILPVMGKKGSETGGGDRGTSGSSSGSMQGQSRSGDTGTTQKDQSRSGSEAGKGDTGMSGKSQQPSGSSSGMGSSSGSSSGMGTKPSGSSSR